MGGLFGELLLERFNHRGVMHLPCLRRCLPYALDQAALQQLEGLAHLRHCHAVGLQDDLRQRVIRNGVGHGVTAEKANGQRRRLTARQPMDHVAKVLHWLCEEVVEILPFVL